MKNRLLIICLGILLGFGALLCRAGMAELQAGEIKETETGETEEYSFIEAECAILLDADTGAVLFERNADEKAYPASITKIMTALLARENCTDEEEVTFSHEAVFGIERGSSHIGIDEGETLSVKDCLYAMLLESANEVSNGVAEHIAGTQADFAKLMNEKAKELGCTGTHFTNSHGLHDENHYTTARDMGKIAKAFFADDMLTEISGTVFYHINSSPTQKDEIDLRNHHKMLIGCQLSGRFPYEYTVGGKTGYTVDAGNTLVTCAEKDGMRLIAVVMKGKARIYFTDTITLFEYGFDNFARMDVSEYINKEEVESRIREAVGNVTCSFPEKMEVTFPKSAKADITYNMEEKENGTVALQVMNGREPVGEITILYEKISEPGVETADTMEETVQEEQRKTEGGMGFPIFLWWCLPVVILLAAAGIFLFFYHKREQERQNRRREILERMRERRTEE